MTDLSEPLFLFGPGYSGKALAKLWPGPVIGTARSPEREAELRSEEIEPVSINHQDALERAVMGAHVVISAPPSSTGCPAIERIGEASGSAASVTYLSTTGVYGDLDGGWAMEWSPANPQSERAQRRHMAEQTWQARAPNLAIVRLPGIYGPGRSAIDRLRAGKARRIVKAGQVFSRAHVDDIARGLFAMLQAGCGGVFNLCDDEAAPPQDVIAFAAEVSGQSAPPEIAIDDAELTPMGRSFYAECKRVSNARLKAATGWRPLYPTYREGLRAIAT